MGNSTSLETSKNKISEDIMIVENLQEIARHFVKDASIVWHDPDISSQKNQQYLQELQTISDVKTFDDWQEACAYLQTIQVPFCQVITSGTNGNLIVKEISDIKNISSIHVFCRNVDNHKEWTAQYPKVVSIDNQFKKLLENLDHYKMIWQRQSSSLRVDLPAFAPIFDDSDKSRNIYLHAYLKGFINFKNREQSKKDFLTLAKTLFGKNTHTDDFEKNYNGYNMQNTLRWYTRETFFYKLVNNCLRIATPDSIQYSRLVLRDLETAVKEQYQQRSKHFSGLLYRGAYVSSQEWEKLQGNIGKDIEMYGFLSTSKQKEVAFKFIDKDIEKKAIITILVPNAPDRGEQGFAELKEYSVFENEEEVLFNVRSRYRILEAATEEINGIQCRHLVLLYGAQALQRYVKVQNPVVKIKIDDIKKMKCCVCQSQIQMSNSSRIYINPANTKEMCCTDCLKQYLSDNLSPLISMIPCARHFSFQIEGFAMRSQENKDLPFYGYRCRECQKIPTKCVYKCLDCEGPKKVYCEQCLKKTSSCNQVKHVMILERCPFAFWSEKMTNEELYSLEYHEKQLLSDKSLLFEQAAIFMNTHQYDKAAKFYHKVIEQNECQNDVKKAIVYNNLGEVYRHMGEYPQAIEFYSKSLEIKEAIFGYWHSETASTYNNLGLAYNGIGKCQRSVEFYLKAIEIRTKTSGDMHLEVAKAYNNLGLAYKDLREFSKAVEVFLKSLRIKQAIIGDQHPETAKSYNNLGLMYGVMKEPKKSIEFLLKSLEIKKIVYGDQHPDTANTYNNLGNAHYDLKKYKEALDFYSKSLDIFKGVMGGQHPSIPTVMESIKLTNQMLSK